MEIWVEFLWTILRLPLEREHPIRGSVYIFQNLHYIESALRSIYGCLILGYNLDFLSICFLRQVLVLLK
jgi:hypothetical protein